MLFSLWASGGKTAKIEAENSYQAVEKFVKQIGDNQFRYTFGSCIGTNPAHFVSKNHDIKIWNHKSQFED